MSFNQQYYPMPQHDRDVEVAEGDYRTGWTVRPMTEAELQAVADRKKAQAERAEKQRLEQERIDALGPHDLFGQSLAVGDTIAWPTSAGRAVGITVGQITKITKKDKRNSISGRMYTVQARPLKAGYSGHYTTKGYKWVGKGENRKLEVTDKEISPVTIQKVQNIVKVEVPAKQLDLRAMSRIEWNDNTLSVKPMGKGSMQGAGAGEQQLWSLIGGIGVPPEQAEEFMANFIPDTRDDA